MEKKGGKISFIVVRGVYMLIGFIHGLAGHRKSLSIVPQSPRRAGHASHFSLPLLDSFAFSFSRAHYSLLIRLFSFLMPFDEI